MTRQLRIITYNSTGLAQHRIEYIRHVIDSCKPDILFLQETWLLPRDYNAILNSINKDYISTGTSGMPGDVIIQGRPYGGLGILWKKDLVNAVKPIQVDHKRLCAAIMTLSSEESLLLLNCYMPNDTRRKHGPTPEFEECVNKIDEIIQQQNCNHILLGGDLNIDLNRNSANLGLMMEYAVLNSLHFSWDNSITTQDYTFSAPGMDNGSVIDHFLLSTFMNNAVIRQYVEDIPMEHGHHPVVLDLMIHSDRIASDTKVTGQRPGIAWSKVNDLTYSQYSQMIEDRVAKMTNLFANIAIDCENCGCENDEHLTTIDWMAEQITQVCLDVGNKIFPRCSQQKRLKACWKEKIGPKRTDSLFWGKIWREVGRPRSGIVWDIYSKTKREYHKAVRRHKNDIEQNRKHKLAEAMVQDNSRQLWSELKKLKPSHKLLPPEVDGHRAAKDICNSFANKYSKLYNSVPSLTSEYYILKEKIKRESKDASKSSVIISTNMVTKAIKQLKKDKQDGDVGFNSNHLLYAPQSIHCLLAKLFTAILAHHYMPKTLLNTTLLSFIKDYQGNICSSENFRGIALTSSINKVLDWIILHNFGNIIKSSDLQYAYKKQHSTMLCTLSLKELISYYNSSKSHVYACLIDASKAFDKVCFDKMFELLQKRGLPPPYIATLMDSYERQQVRTYWINEYSEAFSVSNGIRQGGVLSPLLYTIYMDVLLDRLSQSGYGCFIGHHFMGSVSYADDLTLLSPTIYGLQKMLDICSEYSKEYHVKYNCKKTVCIKFASKLQKQKLSENNVTLDNVILSWQNQVKHLGNWVTSDLNDKKDITEKANDFVHRINGIIVNFSSVNRNTCVRLFESECFFYGSQTWSLHKSDIEIIHVKWRKAIRRIWKLPWTARSGLLHHLMDQKPFIDTLSSRFIGAIKTVVKSANEKLIMMLQNSRFCNGLIFKNLQYIAERWDCSVNELLENEMPKMSRDYEMIRRANMIKELTEMLENNVTVPNFNNDDFKELISLISMY